MNITEERRAREASTSEESSEISEKLIHHFEAVPLLDRRLRRGQTDCGMAGFCLTAMAAQNARSRPAVYPSLNARPQLYQDPAVLTVFFVAVGSSQLLLCNLKYGSRDRVFRIGTRLDVEIKHFPGLCDRADVSGQRILTTC